MKFEVMKFFNEHAVGIDGSEFWQLCERELGDPASGA